MIEFDIAEVTDVRLEVYDVLGRKVKTILGAGALAFDELTYTSE